MKCYPNMYQKSIYNINYKKLKKLGIKCLIFDLDNTIALIDQHVITNETNVIPLISFVFNIFSSLFYHH